VIEVKFRAVEREDLKQLRDWRNLVDLRKNTREYRLLNMLNQEEWFKQISLARPPQDIMFCIEAENRLIGVCGLTHIDWKERHAEVSIYIGDSIMRSKGYAEQSIAFLLDYGFKTLGLHRIYAMIYEYNEVSIKLFEKCDFKYEGKHRKAHFYNGQFWDELIYGILSDEYDPSVQTNNK
jgi:hypothetical protein